MTLGVDVGGTFTDLAHWDGGVLHIGKTSSTPDQSEGVIAGARDLLGDTTVTTFLHGTTVATNALLERRGVRTALVTDVGFAHLIEIGRQDRHSLYDSFVDRPTPLVDRPGRFEVAPDDPAAIDDLLERLAAYDPGAVAISFLYGYEDPAAEQRIAERVRDHLDVAVSTSHVVSGEFREFERLSTTVLNAYLTPVVEGYLRRLRDRAADAGLPDNIEVMRSSGGLMSIDAASELPAAVLLSGPAGGVVASAALGRALELPHVVSFDMGGTSTDVCRIDDGRPDVAYERDIDGLPCRLPAVAIHTVGAGGGSIGWVDDGGALRVGPHSAGADPGPACYARGGTHATVTDANLLLGRIDPGGSLAGTVELDAGAAERALTDLGGRAGLDARATALGMVEVAEAHMARAIRVVSVEEGSDPRDAVLVSFGGAGGLHATSLARGLQMAGVVIPPYAGVFSAFGLLLSPRRTDRARSTPLVEAQMTDLARIAGEVADDARTEPSGDDVTVSLLLDVRYVGQAHETAVAYDPGDDWATIAERFHTAHHERNGFARPDDPIEVVTVRAEATAPAALTWDDVPAIEPSGTPQRGRRRVVTADGVVDADVWWRPGLRPDDEITGPAIIEEREATTYLASDERAVVHASGALEVAW